MEGRGAVEQHRVLADHVIEDVPDLGALLLHHLLGALDGGDVALLFELVVDERLEELECHDLRQAALVQLELRADDDDRAARVVDALAEQVLAEAALLALEHVAERLERPLVRTGDGLAAPAVVEQRVDRLLQHPLLVADDDVRGVELLEPLEAVVAVDDAPVEVVQVAGGEPAAVKRHERAQIRRDDRDHLEHHPLGTIARDAEGLGDLETLGQLLALGVAGRRAHLLAQLLGERLDVDLAQQLANRLTAHPGDKAIVAELVARLVVLVLAEQLAARQRALLRVDDDIALAVEDLLEVLERDIEDVADARGQALEEPDVGDRRGQGDVPETLPAHLGLDDLDAALLADHAAMLHALVLAAITLVVLDRPEDLRAEETVALRLESPVIDRLRLLHLTMRPLPNLVRRGQRDADGRKRQRVLRLLEEIEDVLHGASRVALAREGPDFRIPYRRADDRTPTKGSIPSRARPCLSCGGSSHRRVAGGSGPRRPNPFRCPSAECEGEAAGNQPPRRSVLRTECPSSSWTRGPVRSRQSRARPRAARRPARATAAP